MSWSSSTMRILALATAWTGFVAWRAPFFMSQVVQDPAEAGREAVRRHAWQEGFELFKQADGARELSGDDLEAFAEAALWTSGFEEFLPLMERAYAAHTREDNKARAASVAVHLAHDYNLRLEKSVANGWLRRAQRLLEEEEEAPEHGYLALELGLRALSEHDFDRTLAEAGGDRAPSWALVVSGTAFGASRDVGDFARAGEWTAGLSQFCASHSLS